MDLYKRELAPLIVGKVFKGKAIIIIGARQVGKTTLTKRITDQLVNDSAMKIKPLYFNFDDPDDVEIFAGKGLEYLKKLIGKHNLIIIDEGQRLTEAGLKVKLLVDYFQTEKQFIVTGSSSLNILEGTSEPLTGRKYTYSLMPISIAEILQGEGTQKSLNSRLEEFLIYGQYPEILQASSFEEKRELLDELTDSNLYKDVFGDKQIGSTLVIRKLLQALALQIGSEVSYPKLANLLGIDRNTVENYIDKLIKAQIVYTLPAFNIRPRKEISKGKKIYFVDLGVRNALISDFRSLDLRQDKGGLWENYIISEKIKFYNNKKQKVEFYFWRAYQSGEIDLIELKDSELKGFEIKFMKDHAKPPRTWSETYGDNFYVINRYNYLDYLLKGNN